MAQGSEFDSTGIVADSPSGGFFDPSHVVSFNPSQRSANTGVNGGASQDSGFPGLSASDKAQIDQYLREAGSKDDPSYWYKLAADHGGVANTGADWLKDRIYRGDGSQFVASGQMQKFQDTPAGAPADYLQPFTEQFSADPFVAPTGANEQNDPGYEARLAAVTDAQQRSAAARGDLLSGSTAVDLAHRAQDYASNEYANVYNRAAQTWGTNYSKALGEYNNRKATFYSNQDNPFAKLLAQSTLDSNNQNALNNVNLGYAGLGANVIGNGAAQVGGYMTGGANATAAGQAGAGNAYGSLYRMLGQVPAAYRAGQGLTY